MTVCITTMSQAFTNIFHVITVYFLSRLRAQGCLKVLCLLFYLYYSKDNGLIVCNDYTPSVPVTGPGSCEAGTRHVRAGGADVRWVQDLWSSQAAWSRRNPKATRGMSGHWGLSTRHCRQGPNNNTFRVWKCHRMWSVLWNQAILSWAIQLTFHHISISFCYSSTAVMLLHSFVSFSHISTSFSHIFIFQSDSVMSTSFHHMLLNLGHILLTLSHTSIIFSHVSFRYSHISIKFSHVSVCFSPSQTMSTDRWNERRNYRRDTLTYSNVETWYWRESMTDCPVTNNPQQL